MRTSTRPGPSTAALRGLPEARAEELNEVLQTTLARPVPEDATQTVEIRKKFRRQRQGLRHERRQRRPLAQLRLLRELLPLHPAELRL